MIFERLQVLVREGVTGRPERGDLTFWWRGQQYTGPTISPSATSMFQQCQHKWGLYAIEKQPRVEKKSQAIGLEAHASLEAWLLHREVPRWRRLLDSGALEHFPLPQSEGLQVEQVFAFAFSPYDDLDTVVVYWGFKDAEQGNTVFDLKSTSDLLWAKTREELERDPQANIYAADNLLQTGEDSAVCRWVYCTTRGKIDSDPREVCLSAEHVIEVLSDLHDTALSMTCIRKDKTLRADDLPKNESACGDYGGCDYLSLCKSSRRPGASLRAQHRQSLTEQQRRKEEEPMTSALDAIKAAMAAKKGTTVATPPTVPVAAANARQTTVAAAPAAKAAPASPPPAAPPAAAPKRTGALAAVLNKMQPAQAAPAPAVGVVPPDAPPATVDEEAEEQEAQDEVDAAAPQEPTPPPAAAKKPPGRPKGSTTKPPAAPAPAAAPAKAAPAPKAAPAAGGSFVVFVDVRPLRVGGLADLRDVSELVDTARAQVEAEAGQSIHTIEYGKGPYVVAAQLDENLSANKPVGTFLVSSKAVHIAVLEVLLRHADVAWGGGA